MATHYSEFLPKHIEFMGKQQLYFLASASGEEVNLSPKGLDSLRVLSASRLLFLDLPGSGNRSARDVANHGQITVMWTAFEGAPLILRAFCRGRLVEKSDADWDAFYPYFGEWPVEKIRRLIVLDVLAVESSCGYGVPIMEFKTHRSQLTDWLDKKLAKNQLEDYIESHAVPPTIDEMRTNTSLND